MMLSVGEVHFYNNLVESEKVHNVIFCPFDKTDIVITKVDEDDMPYFYCIGCKISFKLSSDAKEYIRLCIDKFKDNYIKL